MLNITFTSVFLGFVLSTIAQSIAELNFPLGWFAVMAALYFTLRYVYTYAVEIDLVSALERRTSSGGRRTPREFPCLILSTLTAVFGALAGKYVAHPREFFLFFVIASFSGLLFVVVLARIHADVTVRGRSISEIQQSLLCIFLTELVLCALALLVLWNPNLTDDAVKGLQELQRLRPRGLEGVRVPQSVGEVEIKMSNGVLSGLFVVLAFAIYNWRAAEMTEGKE